MSKAGSDVDTARTIHILRYWRLELSKSAMSETLARGNTRRPILEATLPGEIFPGDRSFILGSNC